LKFLKPEFETFFKKTQKEVERWMKEKVGLNSHSVTCIESKLSRCAGSEFLN
jgi:hypothetical protein